MDVLWTYEAGLPAAAQRRLARLLAGLGRVADARAVLAAALAAAPDDAEIAKAAADLATAHDGEL